VRQLEGGDNAVLARPGFGGGDGGVEVASRIVERPGGVGAPGLAGRGEGAPAVDLGGVARGPGAHAGVFERADLLRVHALAATSLTTSLMMPVILKSFGV